MYVTIFKQYENFRLPINLQFANTFKFCVSYTNKKNVPLKEKFMPDERTGTYNWHEAQYQLLRLGQIYEQIKNLIDLKEKKNEKRADGIWHILN